MKKPQIDSKTLDRALAGICSDASLHLGLSHKKIPLLYKYARARLSNVLEIVEENDRAPILVPTMEFDFHKR